MYDSKQLERAVGHIIDVLEVPDDRRDNFGGAVLELLPRQSGIRLSGVYTGRPKVRDPLPISPPMLTGWVLPKLDEDAYLAIQEPRVVLVPDTAIADGKLVSCWSQLGYVSLLHLPLDLAGGVPSAAHKVNFVFTLLIRDREWSYELQTSGPSLREVERALARRLRRFKAGRLVSTSEAPVSIPQMAGQPKEPIASLFERMQQEMPAQGLMMVRAWNVERRADRDDWSLLATMVEPTDAIRQVDRACKDASVFGTLTTKPAEEFASLLTRVVGSGRTRVVSGPVPHAFPFANETGLNEVILPIKDGVSDIAITFASSSTFNSVGGAKALESIEAFADCLREVFDSGGVDMPLWRRESVSNRILAAFGDIDDHRRSVRLKAALHAWRGTGAFGPDSGLLERLCSLFSQVVASVKPLLYMSAWRVRPSLSVKYSNQLGGPWLRGAGSLRLAVEPMSDPANLIRLQRLVRTLGDKPKVMTLRWNATTSAWEAVRGGCEVQLPAIRWPSKIEAMEALVLRIAVKDDETQFVFLPEIFGTEDLILDDPEPLSREWLERADSFLEIRMDRVWPGAELLSLAHVDHESLGQWMARSELESRVTRHVVSGPLAQELGRRHPTMTMNLAAALHPGGAYRSGYRNDYNGLFSEYSRPEGGISWIADSNAITRMARTLYLSRFGAGEEGDPCLVRYARLLLRPDGYRERGLDPPALHPSLHVCTGLHSYATHLVSFVRDGARGRQVIVVEVFAWRAGFSPVEAEASGPRGSVRRSLRQAVGAIVERYLGADPRSNEPRSETVARLGRELKERRHFRTDLITWNREQARDVSDLIQTFLGEGGLQLNASKSQPVHLPIAPTFETQPTEAKAELKQLCLALQHLVEATGDTGRTRLRWSLVMDARGDRALRRTLFKWTEWLVTHADSWSGAAWERIFAGLVSQMLS